MRMSRKYLNYNAASLKSKSMSGRRCRIACEVLKRLEVEVRGKNALADRSTVAFGERYSLSRGYLSGAQGFGGG